MSKKYQRVLVATASEAIPFVSAGLPVTDDGYFFSESQMDSMESNFAASETATANLEAAQQATTEATAKLGETKTRLTAAEAKVAEHEKTIEEQRKEIARLEALDAGKISQASAGGDPSDGEPVKLNFAAPADDPRFK